MLQQNLKTVKYLVERDGTIFVHKVRTETRAAAAVQEGVEGNGGGHFVTNKPSLCISCCSLVSIWHVEGVIDTVSLQSIKCPCKKSIFNIPVSEIRTIWCGTSCIRTQVTLFQPVNNRNVKLYIKLKRCLCNTLCFEFNLMSSFQTVTFKNSRVASY